MSKSEFENEYEALSCLAQGNLAAYNFIYYKYCQLIFGNICKYVKDSDLAEDILQDVFLTLWEKRAAIKFENSVGGWLFTVSYHKSVEQLKKRLKHRMVIADSTYLTASQNVQTDTEKETEYQYKISLLEEAVNLLPAKKQKIYRLNKFEHKQPDEISEELGLTIISVKHYLKQCNKLIKQYVQYKYPIDIILLFCMWLELFFKL